MSSSQWLDIAVLAVAFIAAVSGWRSGALGSLLSFVGVLLGAIAGVLLAPHLVAHVAAPRAKLFAALFLILALVVVGEVAGDDDRVRPGAGGFADNAEQALEALLAAVQVDVAEVGDDGHQTPNG